MVHFGRNYPGSHSAQLNKSYCKEKVVKGIVPNYRFLSGIHHSQHWRYWRSIKLKNELRHNSMKELLIKTLLENNLTPSVKKIQVQ